MRARLWTRLPHTHFLEGDHPEADCTGKPERETARIFLSGIAGGP
jgi:hypothetical protein